MSQLKSLVWQLLNAKMKVQHVPARPMPFPKRLHLLFLASGVVMLTLFILWSAATTGYEPYVDYDSNFNQSQPKYWYTKFAPSAYSDASGVDGSICDPYYLSTSDQFTTTHDLFQYTVQYSNRADGSYDYYANTTLEYCDVSSISITIDLASYTFTSQASINCSAPWAVYLSSEQFTTSPDNTQKSTAAAKLNSKSGSETLWVIYLPLDDLALDIYERVQDMAKYIPNSPRHYSFSYDNEDQTHVPCDSASCSPVDSVMPNATMSYVFQGYENGTTWDSGASDHPTDTFNLTLDTTLNNFVQAYISALRFDLGIIRDNNIFTNADALRSYIRTTDTDITLVAENLNASISTGDNGNVNLTGAQFLADLLSPAESSSDSPDLPIKLSQSPLSLNTNGHAYIDVLYRCNKYKVKGFYSWVNSVLGIAWSNFSATWIIVIALLTILARIKYGMKDGPAPAAPGTLPGPRGPPPPGPPPGLTRPPVVPVSPAPPPSSAPGGSNTPANAPARPQMSTLDSAKTLVMGSFIKEATKVLDDYVDELKEEL